MVKVTHTVLDHMVEKAIKGFKMVTVKLWHGSGQLKFELWNESLALCERTIECFHMRFYVIKAYTVDASK